MRTSFLLQDWKFYLGNDVPMAFYKGFDDSGWKQVQIPHDWSVEYPFDRSYSSGTGYVCGGIGWYRCRFDLPELSAHQRVRVTFQGVYNNSQVWCNTNNLGKRPYGYSTFSYDLTPFVLAGENQISVKVSHTDLADSRWFTGSGIYRPVKVEIYDERSFDEYGVFCVTKQADQNHGDLEITWKARGDQVRFSLMDRNDVCAASKTVDADKERCVLPVSAPHLWSSRDPYLYTLVSEVLCGGTVTDCVRTPIGIRTALFDADRGLFINGVSTKLKGVCVHHDAGVLGAAVPKEVWRRRLEILRQSGCNAIRTSHNPPAPDLLDLCDEMGFYVMDEAFDEWEGCKNKWWQGHNVYPPKHYGYAEDFPVWHEADLSAMICRDRNHPSILMWSIGNEIDYPNDPYCSKLFATMTGNNDASKPPQEREYDPNKPDGIRLGQIARELVSIVKKHDLSRPVTAALAFPELSNQVGYADALDIVGYNYKEHLYAAHHAAYPGRVLYGSENGASLENWRAVRDNDYICGQFLWTGIDYLGEAGGWPYRLSCAGMLETTGLKKPGFYRTRANWSDGLFAELGTYVADGQGLKGREELADWSYEPGDTVTVNCYTNARTAVLYLNGRELETKQQQTDCYGCLTWKVPFEPGTLQVVASRGAEQVRAEAQTGGEPVEIRLCQWKGGQQDSDAPMAQVELTLVDAQGIPVSRKEQTISWRCENAVFMGCDSGMPDDLESYASASRRTGHGRMIAYFRPVAGKTGTVYASMNGREFALTLV